MVDGSRPRASSVDSDDLDGPVASTSQQQVENVATSPKTGAVLVKAQGKAKRSTRQKKTSKNAKGAQDQMFRCVASLCASFNSLLNSMLQTPHRQGQSIRFCLDHRLA